MKKYVMAALSLIAAVLVMSACSGKKINGTWISENPIDMAELIEKNTPSDSQTQQSDGSAEGTPSVMPSAKPRLNIRLRLEITDETYTISAVVDDAELEAYCSSLTNALLPDGMTDEQLPDVKSKRLKFQENTKELIDEIKVSSSYHRKNDKLYSGDGDGKEEEDEYLCISVDGDTLTIESISPADDSLCFSLPMTFFREKTDTE